jgi:superfamily II DNA or RNA helicase
VTRAVKLRAWQRRALTRLEAHPHADFLAVATPGAGKTTFALTALRRRMVASPGRRVVVVAPTAHLKTQWAEAAARFDLVLDDRWSAADGAPPGDVHGVVTTYQQVAGSSAALAAVARDGLVIFDEIHHAGDERAWGEGIRTAFGGASWRLALSGTPFRSDTRAIPFVTYALDEAMPNFEYGYGDALRDGRVVRHVEFPSLNGEMEWISPDGTLRSASFADPLESTLAAQRLRTALSAEGEWLPAVIDAAHAQLTQVRRTCPDAGGLVITTDQDHARDVARLLEHRHGVRAVVATSDDPEASARIARFGTSTDPWIVAVRMVSEGVDLPRLRVGVYATTTTTELFFRQAVGRLLRWRPDDDDAKAWLFIPDDSRLRARAQQIADQRRHSLRAAGNARAEAADPAALDAAPEEQMSLFAAVSAVPVGLVSSTGSSAPLPGGLVHEPDPDDELVLELPPLPVLVATDATEPDGARPSTARSARERRNHLRSLNAARAADLVRYANMSHAKVNAELNRLAGVHRITEATESQLERRLAAAERWLRSRGTSR